MIQRAPIITCTPPVVDSNLLKNKNFDDVINDETSVTTTLEALVAWRTTENLVLVGDDNQLRPPVFTGSPLPRSRYVPPALDPDTAIGYAPPNDTNVLGFHRLQMAAVSSYPPPSLNPQPRRQPSIIDLETYNLDDDRCAMPTPGSEENPFYQVMQTSLFARFGDPRMPTFLLADQLRMPAGMMHMSNDIIYEGKLRG